MAKKYMCMSTCQAWPASWKVNTDTLPIRATAKISRVESPLPEVRHDRVAASAIATMTAVGISQPVPRAMPEVMEFYRMAGDVDYMLRVVVADMASYDVFYKKLISAVPLKNVTSRFAMEKIKSVTALPVPAA